MLRQPHVPPLTRDSERTEGACVTARCVVRRKGARRCRAAPCLHAERVAAAVAQAVHDATPATSILDARLPQTMVASLAVLETSPPPLSMPPSIRERPHTCLHRLRPHTPHRPEPWRRSLWRPRSRSASAGGRGPSSCGALARPAARGHSPALCGRPCGLGRRRLRPCRWCTADRVASTRSLRLVLV